MQIKLILELRKIKDDGDVDNMVTTLNGGNKRVDSHQLKCVGLSTKPSDSKTEKIKKKNNSYLFREVLQHTGIIK